MKRVFALFSAALAVAAVAIAGQPAFAVLPASESTTPVAASTPSISMTLTTASENLQPAQDLNFAVTVTNRTSSRLANLRLALYASDQLLSSEQKLEAYLDPTRTITDATYLGPRAYFETTADIAAGATTTIQATVQARYLQTSGLLSSSGVLPIAARLVNGFTTVASAINVVNWNMQDVSSTISTIVPITAPPAADELYSSTELAALTAPDGSLSAQLNAVAGESVTIAVDPKIPQSILALGAAAPPTTLEWLQRLRGVPSIVPLAWGDADYASLAASGIESVPNNLEDAGIEWTQTNVAIVPDGRLSTGALALLRRSGIRTAVADQSDITATGTSAAPTRDGVTLIASNGSFVNALLTAAAEGGPQSDRLVRATAALAASTSRTGSTIVAVLPRDWYTNTIVSRSVFDALQVPWLSPKSTIGVATAKTATATVPRSVTTFDAATVRGVASARNRSLTFATAFVHPDQERLRLNRSFVSLFGLGWFDAADRWSVAAATYRSEAKALTSSLRLVSTSNLTLISGRSAVPVPLVNEGTNDVVVKLALSPSNGRIIVGEFKPLTIKAHETITAKVPVEAVANGQVTLRVRVLSTSGALLVGPTERTMTVRADIETWVTVSGLGLIALLMAVGIYRTVRRRRAERDADDSAAAEALAAPSTSEDARG